jgi:DNA-binding transcriptional ArsR family regulator
MYARLEPQLGQKEEPKASQSYTRSRSGKANGVAAFDFARARGSAGLTKFSLDKLVIVHNHMVVQPGGYGVLAPTQLDATFAALADPTRRAILARLAKGEASVLELAEPFEMSQPAISKHLKVLERAGLVTQGKDAQRRPRRLEAQPLADATEYLETYREFWEKRFHQLDALLVEMKGLQQKSRHRKNQTRHKTRSTKPAPWQRTNSTKDGDK